MKINEGDIELWKSYQADWNKFARDILNVKLDPKQEECLTAIQLNKKISIRSGNARGKDYVAAVAALCFFYLYYPSKVICTAPTQRQVVSINFAEISSIHRNARITLPGEVLTANIKVKDETNWFVEGFKAADKASEAWQGYHSPNIMVIYTEASSGADETFNAIEGILTGENPKLLLIFNPNRTTGEAYRSTQSQYYTKIKMNGLDAPNVIAKKTIYQGQVDYDWVKDKVERWCTVIEEIYPEYHDFEFEGVKYRPNDLFRVKVLGEFPLESEDQVFPLKWVEMAFDRWRERQETGFDIAHPLRLGVDVAGMGRDKTVFAFRYLNTIIQLKEYSHSDHMETAGRIKNELKTPEDFAFVDTIGEGAGVHSRLAEQKINSVSAKTSEDAKGLYDHTGERTFANMRAFLIWAVRDALDPKFDGDLALPPDDELLEELTTIQIKGLKSDGSILIEPKDDIKARLGRSPDKSDAVFNTFYPYGGHSWLESYSEVNVRE
jgi:hypothetical protein